MGNQPLDNPNGTVASHTRCVERWCNVRPRPTPCWVGSRDPGSIRGRLLAGDDDGARILDSGAGDSAKYGGRIDAVELGGFDHAVEDGRDLGSAVEAIAVEVLAPDDGARNTRSAALLSSGTLAFLRKTVSPANA